MERSEIRDGDRASTNSRITLRVVRATMLQVGAIKSPVDAVRAAIVTEHREGGSKIGN